MKISQNWKQTIWRFGFHGAAAAFYSAMLSSFMASGYVVFVERMITSWYLVLHIVFVFLLVLQDLINLLLGRFRRINNAIAKLNNILFVSIVFPFALCIPLTYWSLFYYNSDLIHPSFLEISMPLWVSKSSHSVITLVALLEMTTTKYTYKGNYLISFILLTTFSGCYVTCLMRTYSQFGFWIYPVFHLFPQSKLPLVFSLLAALLIGIFFLGSVIANFIHNKPKVLKCPCETSPDESDLPESTEDLLDFMSQNLIDNSNKIYDATTENRGEHCADVPSFEPIDDLPPPPSLVAELPNAIFRSYQEINNIHNQYERDTPFFYNSTGKIDMESVLCNDQPQTLPTYRCSTNHNKDCSKGGQKSNPNKGNQTDEKKPSAPRKPPRLRYKSFQTSASEIETIDEKSKPHDSPETNQFDARRINKQNSHLRDFARNNGDLMVKRYNESENLTFNIFEDIIIQDPFDSSFLGTNNDPNINSDTPTNKQFVAEDLEEIPTEGQNHYLSNKANSLDSLESIPATPFGRTFPSIDEDRKLSSLKDLAEKRKKFQSVTNLYIRDPLANGNNDYVKPSSHQDPLQNREKQDNHLPTDGKHNEDGRKSKIPKRRVISDKTRDNHEDDHGEPGSVRSVNSSGVVLKVTQSNVKKRRIGKTKDNKSEPLTICLVIT